MADSLSITNVPTHLGMMPHPARDEKRRKSKLKTGPNTGEDDGTSNEDGGQPAETGSATNELRRTGTQIDVEA